MKLRYFLFVILICLLVACSGSSGEGADKVIIPLPEGNENEETNSNRAPELTPIAKNYILLGDSVRLKLDATDLDGDNLIYSADGSAGSFGNPFSQTTPAVFNAVIGEFNWTPTEAEIGQYSVMFTVTEKTLQALSTSIIVDFTVETEIRFEKNLYITHCASCHGVDGTGITGSDIRFKMGIDIANALENVTAMQKLAGKLVQSQIDAIVGYVETQFPSNNSHNEFDFSNGCAASSCHDGSNPIAKSKPLTHITTTDVCQACHNIDSFVPAMIGHKQLVGYQCADCHASH